MTLLYAIFFGAGVTAFVYTKMGRRVGYDNGKSLWTIVGVVFLLTTIVAWTVLATIGI
jgi:tetrahydromethanopterin S-methyltransferase subunit G